MTVMPAGSMAQVSGAGIIMSMSPILSILPISSIMSMDWALTMPASAISSRQQTAIPVICEIRFMSHFPISLHSLRLQALRFNPNPLSPFILHPTNETSYQKNCTTIARILQI